MRLPLFAALVAACYVLPAPGHASANNHDSCTGYIESLPTSIGTAGTWCLRKNLTTDIASGDAIAIGASNVRIDCGGFRIVGLAGTESTATGIRAQGPANMQVRGCVVSGFQTGVIASGSGSLVEDNRIEGNERGMLMNGYADPFMPGAISIARRNAIIDSETRAIESGGVVSITDNLIDGVTGQATDEIERVGIFIWAADRAVVSGNIVRNIGPALYAEYGILVRNSVMATLRDNIVVAMPGFVSSIGIYCEGNTKASRDNQVSGWASGVQGCVSYDDDTLN